jgi:hypothetical protein
MVKNYRTFEERYEYLTLHGVVGEATFGYDRWINQQFYSSSQWKHMRSFVINRDNGCDLGAEDHEIFDRIIIHHMNPMSFDDIAHGESNILDPEFLITVSHRTHNAIHYGDKRLLPKAHVDRRPGDTKLW